MKTVFNTTDSRLSGFTRSVNRKVIQNIIEIDSFKNLYPAARMANRKIHYYFGETNSGKTFNAFEEASKYNSGLYAAPLRLLALEGQEEFEKRGKTCSMITGEERDEKEGAKFISSTVEMVDYSREYDVAIIDEVQLINDINRGHSWFEAIVGINAKNIYLVGSEDADLVIKEVIEYLGEELIKKEFKRKTRLEFDKELYRNSIKNIGKLPPNSAVIAFSKSKVLKLKKQFENMGNKVSVIYGALPPEVRKIETARFNTGKTDVIIATDAIGMGLNLPIENIFFYENMKFDGVNTIDLDASLVKQIVGRAGRYNKFEVGYVSALSDEVFDFINKEFYKDSFINKRSVKCSPNYQIIKQISLLTSENEIFKLLQNYNNAINFDFDIKNHMNEHSYTIARYLDKVTKDKNSLTLREKVKLVNAPLSNDRANEVLNFFKLCIQAQLMLKENNSIFPYDIINNLLKEIKTSKIKELDIAVKKLDIISWMSFNFEDFREIRDNIKNKRIYLNNKIISFLRSN